MHGKTVVGARLGETGCHQPDRGIGSLLQRDGKIFRQIGNGSVLDSDIVKHCSATEHNCMIVRRQLVLQSIRQQLLFHFPTQNLRRFSAQSGGIGKFREDRRKGMDAVQLHHQPVFAGTVFHGVERLFVHGCQHERQRRIGKRGRLPEDLKRHLPAAHQTQARFNGSPRTAATVPAGFRTGNVDYPIDQLGSEGRGDLFIRFVQIGKCHIVPEVHPVELPLPLRVVDAGGCGGIEQKIDLSAGELIRKIDHRDLATRRPFCRFRAVTPVFQIGKVRAGLPVPEMIRRRFQRGCVVAFADRFSVLRRQGSGVQNIEKMRFQYSGNTHIRIGILIHKNLHSLIFGLIYRSFPELQV